MSGEAPRLLIVEEALKDKRGHWYEYNRAIVTEARRRGIATTLLAHANVAEDIQEELGATPTFPVTSWDGGYNHPSIWRRYIGLLHHNARVAAIVARFLHRERAFDVILVPTVVLYHWLAWRWVAFRGKRKWFRKLVLTTRNNAGEYDSQARRYVFKSSAQVLKRVVASFRGPVGRGEVSLASDSSRIAAQYEEFCGIPFTLYPHPVDDRIAPPLKPSPASSLLTFGALGPPRFEKGSDLILEAIRLTRLHSEGTRLRFIVQWNTPCHDASGRTILPGADLESDDRVTLIPSELATDEYRHWLSQCHVLLLPYRRAQYHARLSGVAVEAFRAGIPCICCSDTWISETMTQLGGGIAIAEESPEALARAILEMDQHYYAHAQRAAANAPKARRHHCVESFMDQLFRIPATSESRQGS